MSCARLIADDQWRRSTDCDNPKFDEEFRVDTDRDRIQEVYEHYRPPLELKVTSKASGASLRAMVVHAKSKGIFNAVDQAHLQRESDRNRRKLLAECTSIRSRVDQWLDDGEHVVVMGDINDGPGLDYYEQAFDRSAVEIIMGDLFDPSRILLAPTGRPKFGRFGWEPSSAPVRRPHHP